MTTRTIHQVIPARLVNMGGLKIDQPLPARGVNQIDPFLLIHHGSLPVEAGQKQQDAGVGPHPHRGFSPVTFVFKGSIHHRDSLGHDAVVTDGGTQWMHAGNGVIHSERPGVDMLENGGQTEIIQFWVNTPAKHKMEAPYYLPMAAEATPTIEKNNATISVVAGKFDGVTGPAQTYSPQTLLRVEAKAGAELTFDLPKTYNTLVYLLDGELEIEDTKVGNKDLTWFNNDGERIELKASKNSRFIVLSGEPIGEQVATYGPFVMNTNEEIQQAMFDYQSGKMGELIEKFD